MSRAFVKEAENETAELPDRLISPHRNFVTEAGLAAIEAALGRFESAHAAATDKGDRGAADAASREVRYWRARRASAEVVKPLPPEALRHVAFLRHFEKLAGDCFRLALKQRLDCESGLVPRAFWAAVWIAALARFERATSLFFRCIFSRGQRSFDIFHAATSAEMVRRKSLTKRKGLQIRLLKNAAT